MKLRLLLFKDYNKNCAYCSNKNWNLDKLEIEKDFTGYDEIILTGGEPMLKPFIVIETAIKIRKITNAKLYMYTAKLNKPLEVLAVLNYLDGITVTLHKQSDVSNFIRFEKLVKKIKKSFRLNVFNSVNFDYSEISNWIIKDKIKWIKNCPLPRDEVFKRIE
jgi:molybdenum cofactor biosynthesis enzyme MoaA